MKEGIKIKVWICDNNYGIRVANSATKAYDICREEIFLSGLDHKEKQEQTMEALTVLKKSFLDDMEAFGVVGLCFAKAVDLEE